MHLDHFDVAQQASALPLQQSRQYMRALLAMGHTAQRFDLGDTGHAIVLIRGPLRYAARGPIWVSGVHHADVITVLLQAPFHVVDADATTAPLLRELHRVQIVTPSTIATLSLFADPDWQLATTKPKWRNASRKGRAAALQISHATFDLRKYGWLLSRDRDQQKAKGFRAMPQAFTAASVQKNPTDARIWIASVAGMPAAEMLF